MTDIEAHRLPDVELIAQKRRVLLDICADAAFEDHLLNIGHLLRHARRLILTED
jgi:hypothetical protein